MPNGLQPIIDLTDPAPSWAEGSASGSWPPGSVRPDPAEFGRFAHAAAVRYSGSFNGLPRVRYYQDWNEPNVYRYLSPQYENGALASAQHYRSMLQEFAAAVHGVHGDNVVIAGSLSPFTQDSPTAPASAPMRFMRELLCMSASNAPLPGCSPALF